MDCAVLGLTCVTKNDRLACSESHSTLNITKLLTILQKQRQGWTVCGSILSLSAILFHFTELKTKKKSCRMTKLTLI